MSTYEDKINRFGTNKKLIRLQTPLKNSVNLPCDVCESTRPTLLFALREPDTGHFYFVGSSCLNELTKLGTIVRRSRKESAELAFKTEMERRRAVLDDDNAIRVSPENSVQQLETENRSVEGHEGAWIRFYKCLPVLLVSRSSERYLAHFLLIDLQGRLLDSRIAQEPRTEERWGMQPHNGFVLEKVKRERPDALALCIRQAWQSLCTQLAELTAKGTGDLEIDVTVDLSTFGEPALRAFGEVALDLFENGTEEREPIHFVFSQVEDRA